MRIDRVAPALLVALVLSLSALAAPAGAVTGEPPPPPAPALLLDQPRRGEDAVRRLGSWVSEAAARSEGTVRELVEHLRTDPAVWVDRAGHAFAVEPAVPAPARTVATAVASTGVASVGTAGSSALRLHSSPGSKRVIYLDFDGATISGTGWNTSYTGGAPYTAAAYDADGRPGFSAAELATIESVWRRVAEDFSPFDVDVTTEAPPAGAIDRSSAQDDTYGTRALITNTTTGYSTCRCGGVAYVGTFDNAGSHARYQPAFVYQRGVGPSAKTIAEAVSHEVGHNLGLHHDGSAGATYFSGHGAWAPIMGASYYKPVTQWSRGEYAGATNREDDLSVMRTNGLSLRADDHGDRIASATALPGSGPRVSARITTRADVDAFSFSTGGGTTSITVTPAGVGADLDLRLRVFTSSGRSVSVLDPLVRFLSRDSTTGLSVSFRKSLPKGSYVVLVDGVGAGSPVTGGYSDYGSIGRYALAASIPAPLPLPPSGAKVTASGGRAAIAWTDRSTNESGFEVLRERRDPVTGSWSAAAVVKKVGANVRSTTDAPAPGTYRYRVRAYNGTGRSASTSAVTFVVPAPPPPPTP